MGLLWMDYGTEFQNLVDAAFECDRINNERYFRDPSLQALKIMRRDMRYNIDFLYTAFVLEDARVMEKYAIWLFELMAGVFKASPNAAERAYSCVMATFDSIKQACPSVLDPKKSCRALAIMEQGCESLAAYVAERADTPAAPTRYEKQVAHYLELLLARDTRGAMAYVCELVDRSGLSVDDVYVEVLAEAMRRVGELWHTAAITVDTEHYCTSTTQTAMSQLYPRIFAAPRRGKTVVVACPGAELHEMPARMVADVFENNGWDSVYLGAAVPQEYLLQSVRTNNPDLVALSVTMPQFLIDCEALVRAVKQEFPQVKVAVGGHAFDSTNDIWRKWPVDFFALDARRLLDEVDAVMG